MIRLRHNKRNLLLIAALAVIVVVVVLELSNTTHLFHKQATVSQPGAPIRSLPHTASPNSSNKQATTTNSFGQSTATDNHGHPPSSATPAQSQWLKSASGAIIVKLPAANSTFKSGAQLYGSASVDKIQYRLVDDQVGVISQGFVSVVSGNFSASVNFSAHSSSGRLDVFSTDSQGKEINEVQVPLKF